VSLTLIKIIVSPLMAPPHAHSGKLTLQLLVRSRFSGNEAATNQLISIRLRVVGLVV